MPQSCSLGVSVTRESETNAAGRGAILAGSWYDEQLIHMFIE